MTPTDRLAAGFEQTVSRVTRAIDGAMAVSTVVLLLVLLLIAVDSGHLRWPWFERAVVARARRLRPARERYRAVAALALGDEVAAMRAPGGWVIIGGAAERAALAAPALAARLTRSGAHASIRFLDDEVGGIAAMLQADGLRLALANAPQRDLWSFPIAGGTATPEAPPTLSHDEGARP